MHVRRFEAATLAEALAQVREQFGPDALVLSTREVRRNGGWLGVWGRSVVEVTAAVDREARRGKEPEAAPRAAADPSWRELQITRALVEPLEGEIAALRRSVLELGSAGALPLAAEVAELRRVTRELARSRGRRKGTAWTRRFLDAGLVQDHAERLGVQAAARAKDGADEAEALLASLAAELDPHLAAARDDDPPVTLFVGPTGAGKTTSLAKLAARTAGERRDLGVVTTDAHRLGADAALRSHAHNLELPFDVAVSDRELARVVKRDGARRLLVDTAGRSPSEAGLAELRGLRGALGSHARVELVVSATTNPRDLQRALTWYRPLAPDSLVVTKLDESADLGSLANLLLDGDAPPLRWITNGQRVPQDLALPEPRQLAAQILGVQP